MPESGWLALVDGPAAVTVSDARTGAAVRLLLTRSRNRPDRDAVRIERRLIGDGPALALSLVLPPRGARPLFDDPAVVGAMRAVMRDPGRAPLFSTLVDGSTRWAGAVSGIDAESARRWPAWWDGDPFARLGPRHRLLVPAGHLTPIPLPAGPGHQRHAGAPWPWGTFASAG